MSEIEPTMRGESAFLAEVDGTLCRIEEDACSMKNSNENVPNFAQNLVLIKAEDIDEYDRHRAPINCCTCGKMMKGHENRYRVSEPFPNLFVDGNFECRECHAKECIATHKGIILETRYHCAREMQDMKSSIDYMHEDTQTSIKSIYCDSLAESTYTVRLTRLVAVGFDVQDIARAWLESAAWGFNSLVVDDHNGKRVIDF